MKMSGTDLEKTQKVNYRSSQHEGEHSTGDVPAQEREIYLERMELASQRETESIVEGIGCQNGDDFCQVFSVIHLPLK